MKEDLKGHRPLTLKPKDIFVSTESTVLNNFGTALQNLLIQDSRFPEVIFDRRISTPCFRDFLKELEERHVVVEQMKGIKIPRDAGVAVQGLRVQFSYLVDQRGVEGILSLTKKPILATIK